MINALHVNDIDTVATALVPLHPGDVALGVTILEEIPKGHKFATAPIKKGESIIKYASHIGAATVDIEPGQWVHVHNLEGERGRGDTDSEVRDIEQEVLEKHTVANAVKEYKFQGYRREDGSFGFRNHVLVIPSVHCANKVVERIATAVKYGPLGNENDNSVVYVTHQHGCSELDYDAKQTMDTIAGTGANPNVFSVLVVGLGCEGVPAKDVADAIKARAPYKDVQYFTIQGTGGPTKSVAKGVEIVTEMVKKAREVQKSEGTMKDIILGTECGGSDSFSGLSANPSLGVACDMVIAQGGRVILAETTELIGAEHLLAARAVNEEVRTQILDTIKGFEQEVIDSKADIRGANPSPGNIEGGLSSIEEKSLGCIYKAGNQPVNAVVPYAAPVTAPGLTFMNTPGNDIEQLSGMVAGGCNICVFTTGRGTPTGSPVTPTIKVSTNTALFENMPDAIDINAGTVIEGTKTMEEVGLEILDFIVAVSEGATTKAEDNEQNDFSIWRLATTV